MLVMLLSTSMRIFFQLLYSFFCPSLVFWVVFLLSSFLSCELLRSMSYTKYNISSCGLYVRSVFVCKRRRSE